MQNLLTDLVQLLEQDDRLVADGKLLKNKVVELALGLDRELLRLLLTHAATRKNFFEDIDGILVFDKIKFQRFVSNKLFLPDSYTAFKNRIGLAAADEYLTESQEVVLVWPYKDCVLEGGQDKEEAQRAEVFWNETLAPDQIDRLLSPKATTNFARYDARGRHDVVELSKDDSFIVKGNNLLTLHTLKRAYVGLIKLIYIDPPYNPDSDANTFCYNNAFNHSTWLTFMHNRLSVAKELLRKDGVLIVAIDKNEQAYLGVLLAELFPKYEIHCITIVHNPRGVQGANFSYTHEFAFFVLPAGIKSIGDKTIGSAEIDWAPFRNWGSESERSDAKNCFYPVIVEDGKITGFGDVLSDSIHPQQNEQHGKQIYVYPIDIRGKERKWRYARQSVESIRHLLRLRQTNKGYDVELGKDFRTHTTVWSDNRYDANAYGTQLVKSLVPSSTFDFPKSLYNVYDCLKAVVGNDKDAIVLDFFAGSGTTGHAVLELNKDDGGDRKFILCEQMDYVESITRARVAKVLENNGAGSFVYCELLTANETFISHIQDATSTAELMKIWGEMQDRAFLSHRLASAPDIAHLDIDNLRRFLIDILDKNMLYVPLSEIDDQTFEVSPSDKKLNSEWLRRAGALRDNG